jgi:hypothetical protein
MNKKIEIVKNHHLAPLLNANKEKATTENKITIAEMNKSSK